MNKCLQCGKEVKNKYCSLLCPNCHAMTPNAKSKNLGFGRKARGISLG